MKSVYIYMTTEEKDNWGVTTLDAEAKLYGGNSYELATVDDLEEWLAATGEIFYEPVQTADGIVIWNETSGEEDDFCGYIEVADDDHGAS